MRLRQKVALIWFVVASAYAIYGWVAYAGFYRWAAEQQLARFGRFEVTITLFGTLFILVLPALIIGGNRRQRVAPVVGKTAGPDRIKRVLLALIAIGVLGIAGGAAAGWLGYQRSQMTPTTASFTVNGTDQAPPASDLVTVTGIVRTDMIVRFTETINGTATMFRYVPLVASAWQPDMPVGYFLKTNQDVYIPADTGDGHGVQSFTPRNPPFQMTTEPSVLHTNDLPGPVQAAFEKAGLKLSPTMYVVDQSPMAMTTPYWVAAVLGIALGLLFTLAGALSLLVLPIRRRRLARQSAKV